jgi:hypothetical protein
MVGTTNGSNTDQIGATVAAFTASAPLSPVTPQRLPFMQQANHYSPI